MYTPPRSFLAVLCAVALCLYSVYLGAVGILLPYLGKTFGLGSEAQGRLFPANFVGFVVGVLLCGYLSDRFGRKAVLLAGIGVFAGGLGLFGIARAYPVALLASLLVGGGSGAMEVVVSALAVELYPERRAVILNLLQVAFGAGAAVAPTLARTLLVGGTDWRTLYLGLGLLNVLILGVLAISRIARVETHEALDWNALQSIVRDPAFATLCLIQGLYVGAEVSYFSWLPTYLETALVGGKPYVGIVGTVFWIAMTVGRFAVGGLLSRVALLRLCAASALGGTIFSGISLAISSVSLVLVAVALTGIFLSGIFTLVLAEAGDRYSSASGSVFGGIVAAGGLGGAIVPWLIGAGAASPAGWRGALCAVPVSLALAAVLSQRLAQAKPETA